MKRRREGSMSRRDGSETGRNIIKFNVLVYGPRSPAITSPRYLLGNREAILYVDPNHPLPLHPSLLHPLVRLSPLFRRLFRTRPFPDRILAGPPCQPSKFLSQTDFCQSGIRLCDSIQETIEKLLPRQDQSVSIRWILVPMTKVGNWL